MQFVVQLILNAKSEMLIFSFWGNFILPQTSHELHNFARWTAAKGAGFFNRGIESRIPKRSWSSAARNSISPIAGLNTAFLQHILLMIEPAAPRMGRGGVQFVQLFCEDLLQSCKAGQTVDLLKLRFALAYLIKSSVTLLPSGVIHSAGNFFSKLATSERSNSLALQV